MGHAAMERRAHQLLDAMHLSLETLINQETTLSHTVATHLERANGRLDAGNSVGAVLSIRKLKSAQAELNRVVRAMDQLETQRDALASHLNEFQALHTLQQCSGPEPTFSNVTTDMLQVDLSSFRSFAADVEKTLTEPIPDMSMSDEELLADFRKTHTP